MPQGKPKVGQFYSPHGSIVGCTLVHQLDRAGVTTVGLLCRCSFCLCSFCRRPADWVMSACSGS